MEKRPYSPPRVTDLGDAVEQTKGMAGDYYETWGDMWDPPVGPPMGGKGDGDDNDDQ